MGDLVCSFLLYWGSLRIGSISSICLTLALALALALVLPRCIFAEWTLAIRIWRISCLFGGRLKDV